MTYVLPVALPLFLIPCFLSWRWLCLWVPVAAAGIALTWWNHFAHAHEGNGFAVVLAEIIIMGGTAAAIAGVVARVMMLALRAGRVRWRYAWLPAPGLLVLLMAAPWLLSWLSEFQNRPPSDACLAATYRIEVGGAELHLPLAPVFTIFRAIDWREIDHLASNKTARAFCDRADAGRTVVVAQLVTLDFVRGLPSGKHRWPARVCDAIDNRPWLARFCAGEVDARAARYPAGIDFEPATKMQEGPFRNLWELYQRALLTATPAEEAAGADVALILHAADGTPFATSCRRYSDASASCYAVFEPYPGLVARFHFATKPEAIAIEALAIQARVAEIAADLLRP
jgi:hypothetical protein